MTKFITLKGKAAIINALIISLIVSRRIRHLRIADKERGIFRLGWQRGTAGLIGLRPLLRPLLFMHRIINPAVKFTGRSGALAAIGRLNRPGAGLLHPRIFKGQVNKWIIRVKDLAACPEKAPACHFVLVILSGIL